MKLLFIFDVLCIRNVRKSKIKFLELKEMEELWLMICNKLIYVGIHLLARCNVQVLKAWSTDYGRPVRKSPSLHGLKSNPNPKFIGMAEAYFRFL